MAMLDFIVQVPLTSFYEVTNKAIVNAIALMLGIPMSQAMFLKSELEQYAMLIFGEIFSSKIQPMQGIQENFCPIKWPEN